MKRELLCIYLLLQSLVSFSQANIVPDIWTASTPVTICGFITVNVDEHNIGNVNAGSNYINVYFSNDAVLGNSDDVYIGQIFVNQGPQASNYSPVYQQTFLVPSATTTGLKYVYFWLNATHSVIESNYNDNFCSRQVQVNSSSISIPTPVFGITSCPGASTPSLVPLTWTGANSSYRINISKYPYGTTPFNNIIYTASCVSGTSLQVNDPNIFAGMLYRWNMTGFNDPTCATCQSSTSTTNYFYIPPSISPSSNQVICTGQSINFSTTSLNSQVNSPGLLTYQWLLNGNPISGATSTSYNATIAGNYSVRLNYSGSSNCSSASIQSNAVSVSINPCCTPTLPASNITFTNIGPNQVTVNWANGDGNKHVVKINDLLQFSNIPNGTDPVANPAYQGIFNQVVYNNTGSNHSVTVTNLQPGTGYYFMVFEGNCTGGSSVYLNNGSTNNPNYVVTQNAQPPTPDFYSLTPIIVAGQTAQFYDQSSNATSLSWLVEKEQWDGSHSFYTSSSQSNPTFLFSSAACYRITLTATNNSGSNSLTRQCYIYAKPDLNAPIPPEVTRAQSYYTYKGGDPVNLANGSFSFSMKDFSIPGVKSLANLERRYFSNSTYESVFGLGWHHSFDIKVDFSNPFDWSVQYPDGHNEHFAPYANGETRSLYPGNFDTLFYTSSGGIPTAFTQIHKDGTRWNFNSNGQIISAVDLDGNQTVFSYNGSNLSTVTLPGGRSLSFTYNGFNKVATVTDNINRKAYYYYDATGHKLDSTRIGNSTTSFKYGANGMTEVYDPRGNRIIQNIYDAQGEVIEQYDAENKKTSFQYNTPVTKATTVTDPLFKIKVIQHDTKSRCIEVKDELNNTVKYGFSLNNTLDTIVDARNFQTIIDHDIKGNPIKNTNAAGFSDSIAYTGLSKPNYIQDKELNVYRTLYSSTGNPTQIILPTGDTIKREYDNQGLDTALIDARGFRTRKIYNVFGDLTQIITPTSATSIAYDAVGRPVEITDSYGRKDSLLWNYFDLLIQRKDKMGRVEEFGYDENGNQIFYKDKKNQITTMQYDKYDKPIKITEPQNHVTEYEYDDNQRVKKLRDPNKNTLIFNYDDAGRVLSVADSILGVLSQKTYDANSNVLSYSDALNKIWTNRVDPINRITSTMNPLGDSVQFKYNKNNQPIEQIDEDGKSSKWEYDAAGRHIKSIDGSTKYVQRFLNKNGLADSIRDARGKIRNKAIYDGSNRLLTLNDGFGNYSMTWDSSDNVKTIKDPDNRTKTHFYNNNNELLDVKIGSNTLRHYLPDDNGQFLEANSGTQNATVIRNQLGWVTQYTNHYSNTIEHVYDSVGNTKRIIYPGGKQVDYKYNSLNKCIEVKDWANRIFTITRNNNGDITSILYANNFKTEITRDDAMRVSAWVNKNNADSIYQSNLVARSKSGNILKDSGISVLSFTPIEQLSVATYGNDDRMLTYGNNTITSNNSGQRLQLTAPGKSYNYAWSPNGELDSSNHAGAPQYLKYDAFNERTIKTTASAISRYIVDHYLAPFPIVLQERNDANQELLNYLYIPGEGILLARDSLGTLLFYHHDIKGNTIALSNSMGQITDRYNYNEFGDSIYHSGTSIQPYTWMGMYGVQYDGNGLYYLHARYFDGNTGTFISKDPYTSNYLSTQDINRYVYGYNNPLTYSDPTGLFVNNISCEGANWSKFIQDVGDATLYLGPVWQKAMDHPILSGFAVGFLAAPAAAGAAEGVLAFSAATYPGVGTAYIIKNSIVGSVYLYLSADGLNSIPKSINSISEALTKKTSHSVVNVIYNVGKDFAIEIFPEPFQSISDITSFVTSALDKLFNSNKLR